MQLTVNERVNFLVNTLKEGNKSAFAKDIGVGGGVIQDIVGGRLNKPSFDVLNKIVNAYPQIDIPWLVTGEGQPFKTESGMVEKTHTNMQVYNNGKDKTVDHQQIPLYNLMAAAGLVTLYNSNQYILDYISIPNLPKCDGAVYVAGDSMYPLLKSGDIVIFRKVSDMQDGIFYGEMHVVEYLMSDDYITTVKFVQKSDKDGYIRLVSENRHHQPKDIPLSKVKGLAVVKASIRINAMV